MKGRLPRGGNPIRPIMRKPSKGIAKHYKFKTNTPWNKLPKKIQDILLHGSGDEEIEITYNSDNIKSYKVKKSFEGVIGNIKRRWRGNRQQHDA